MTVTPVKLQAAHAELAAMHAALDEAAVAIKDLERTKKQQQKLGTAAKEVLAGAKTSATHVLDVAKTLIWGFDGWVTSRSPAYGPEPHAISAVVSAMKKHRGDKELWKKADKLAASFHWAVAAPATPGGAPTLLPPLLTLAPDDPAKADTAKTVTLWASEPVRPCADFMKCFPQSYARVGGRGSRGAFPLWDACGPHTSDGTQCLCAVTAFGGDKDDDEARDIHLVAKHTLPRVRRLRVSSADARLLLQRQLAALRAVTPAGSFSTGDAEAADRAKAAFQDIFEPLTPTDEGCRAVQAAVLDLAYEDESTGFFSGSTYFFQVHVSLVPLVGAPASDRGADFYCVWRSSAQFNALRKKMGEVGGLVTATPADKIAACDKCQKTGDVNEVKGLPAKVNQERCKNQAFLSAVLEHGGPMDHAMLRDFLLRNPTGDVDRMDEMREFGGSVAGMKGYGGEPEPLATTVAARSKFTQPCFEDTKPLVDIRLPDNECGRIMASAPGSGGQGAPEKKKGMFQRMFGGS